MKGCEVEWYLGCEEDDDYGDDDVNDGVNDGENGVAVEDCGEHEQGRKINVGMEVAAGMKAAKIMMMMMMMMTSRRR